MQWEAQELWLQDGLDKWVNFLPLFELPQEMVGENIRSFMNNPLLDRYSLPECCRDISFPNLDITGWYDYGNGDMLMFRTIVKEAKTDVAREGSRIIIGPWTHSTIGRSRVGVIDFGPNASIDTTALLIRWFDYWLKGVYLTESIRTYP